ncbi:MAG: VTT domain-containing protein [Thiohalobacteraceae bacterium]
MAQTRILQPGLNCWRIRRAHKIAFLIDGADYFTALYHGLLLARSQVLILSWDIYSRLRLLTPEQAGPDAPRPDLSELLDGLVRRHRRLRAYVLNWDFSMLMSLNREWLPIYRLDWKTHRRVRFEMDDHCPFGGSHHQKVVVIDDRLAFAGGLDLTRGRWDTQEHRPRDPRRLAIDDSVGRPYHDVQMAVAGPVAEALGDLARERWRRATGKSLPRARGDAALWPPGLRVDLEEVDVAIVRTEPAYQEYSECREIEQLYLDSIAAARDYIYIENQYFTAPAIAAALQQRLTEDEGPDVIINLPLRTDGWLANQSMDVMRIQLFQKMRAADRHGRLGIYYPDVPGLDEPINLHAKLMIVDDRFVRIGSSNLNNRSMGLDTECDLAIEAGPGEFRISDAIHALRNRLLSEHLDVEHVLIDREVQARGSLLGAIEALRGDGRSLKPLELQLAEEPNPILTDVQLVDPERPIGADLLLHEFVPAKDTRPAGQQVVLWVIVVASIAALGAAWRFTPLSETLDVATLVSSLRELRDAPATPVLMLLLFVIAGLALVPLTALVIATAVAFGPLFGFAYALAGSLVSALAGYALGAGLGRRTVRRLAGKRINAVSRKLAKRGLLTVIVVRVVPVAPFTVINLIAGASHIRFRDFMLGTVVGMVPGMFAIVLLVDRAAASLRSPSWQNILTLILVASAVILAGVLLSRHLLNRAEAATEKPVDAAGSR